jgi:hypothetical protein
MKGLTNDQIEFLKKHNVSFEKVFNAKGYTKSYYHVLMKQQGKIVAFNTTPCNAFGHTLRTRSGHCIQCNTAHLEFQKRNDYSGIIYIAGSLQGQVLKIGYSKAFTIRNASLNRTKYAGLNDWKIIFYVFSPFAGKIEVAIKSKLNKYLMSLAYRHGTKFQKAEEVYSCSFEKAKSNFISVLNDNFYSYKIKRNYEGIEFNFSNLKRL